LPHNAASNSGKASLSESKYFGGRTIVERQAEAAPRPPRTSAGSGQSKGHDYQLRAPVAADGPSVSALIAACPPLDRNSAYCNLLQCTHFAQHCIVAERDDAIVGWVSGYRPPSDPTSFFVWQVAVAPAARGAQLAHRMIAALLERPAGHGVTHLITTVTANNRPSWALFEGLARTWGAPLTKSALFEREIHFAGANDTEWLARIGPLSMRTPQHADQEN